MQHEQILRSLGFDDKLFNGRHQPCPRCGGEDRFRWMRGKDKGYCNQCGGPNNSGGTVGFIDLIMNANHVDVAEAFRIAKRHGYVDDFIVPISGNDTLQAAENSKRRAGLHALWNSARQYVDTPVAEYLQKRGLNGTKLIRHAKTEWWDRDKRAAVEYDTMLVAMYPIVARQNKAAIDAVGIAYDEDSRWNYLRCKEPSFIHKTALTPDGSKASIERNKRYTEAWYPVGAAFHYAVLHVADSPCIVLAEGIESALAGLEILRTNHMDATVLALTNAGNLRNFVPSPNMSDKVFYIFADRDKSYTGQLVAAECAHNLVHNNVVNYDNVKILMPPEAGVDWADLMFQKHPLTQTLPKPW